MMQQQIEKSTGQGRRLGGQTAAISFPGICTSLAHLGSCPKGTTPGKVVQHGPHSQCPEKGSISISLSATVFPTSCIITSLLMQTRNSPNPSRLLELGFYDAP